MNDIAQMQANILFWIIIALFAWQGYQRGLWAELTKLAFIVAGFLIGSPDYLGKMLAQAVNGFYMAFQFLFHGGLEAIATGNFGAESLSKIFEEIADIPPPISKDNYELAMFLAMLFLIGIGYLVSKLFKKDALPGLGLVVGLAMFLNMVIAGLFGAAIPLGLRLVGLDPALSASIFLTTATVVFGFLLLLGLATLILLRLR